MDAYSAGVICLELFNGKRLLMERDKAAFVEVEKLVGGLDLSKPFPEVIAKLLKQDADERSSCREVLEGCEIWKKNKLEVPEVISILDNAFLSVRPIQKSEKMSSVDMTLFRRLVGLLEIEEDMTVTAAKIYKLVTTEKMSIGYCLLLAAKIYEKEGAMNFDDASEAMEGVGESCDIDEYCAAELEILEAMNFCLFVSESENLGQDKTGRPKKKARK